jgi:hypothetical protein
MRQLVNSDAVFDFDQDTTLTFRRGQNWRASGVLDISGYGDENGWIPIGLELTPASVFSGTFTGPAIISGLAINRDEAYQGLFGAANDVTISHIGLINGEITASSDAGALIGIASGQSSTVANIYNTVKVHSTSSDIVAGVIGWGGLIVFKQILNLSDVTGHNAKAVTAATSFTKDFLYRWFGASRQANVYDPFQGNTPYNHDGEAVNCSQFADPGWWDTNLGFTADTGWDLAAIGDGYLPVPTGVTPATDNVPYQCMTSITSNDLTNADLDSDLDWLPYASNITDQTETYAYRYAANNQASQTYTFGKTDSRTQITQRYINALVQTLPPAEGDVTITQITPLPLELSYSGVAVGKDEGDLIHDSSLSAYVVDTPFLATCGSAETNTGIGRNYGTTASPFLIEDGSDLACMRDLVNAGDWGFEQDSSTTFVYRTAGKTWSASGVIDLSAYSDTNDGKTGWEPIGLDATDQKVFSGTFTGPAIISGLKISRTDSNYQGLFGAVKSSSLANLGLVNFNLSAAAGENVGALVGSAAGSTISSIYASGIVAGTSAKTAGIVGASSGDGSNISKLLYLGDVLNTNNDAHAVVGLGTVDKLYRWQGVSSKSDTYAPFSGNASTDPDGLAINCSTMTADSLWSNNLGIDETNGWDLDGISTGYLPVPTGVTLTPIPDNFTFSCMTSITSNDVTNAAITSKDLDLVPYATNSDETVTYAYRYSAQNNSAQTITFGDDEHATGKSYMYINSITELAPAQTSPDDVISLTTTVPLPYELSYSGTNESDLTDLIQDTTVSAYVIGTPFGVTCLDNINRYDIAMHSGTEEDPFLVSTATDLACMRDLVNSDAWGISQAGTIFKYRTGKNWRVSGDFSLIAYTPGSIISPKGWLPIGTEALPFSGTFTGDSGPRHASANISDLGIDRDANQQGLFGVVEDSSISNLNLRGSIIGQSQVGALAGSIDSSTISNLVSSVEIKVDAGVWPSYAGGIAGLVKNSQVEQITFSGSISGYYSTGGIIGSLENSQVTQVVNQGSVAGNAPVGGIVGTVTNSVLSEILNTGNVAGSASIGGIAGDLAQSSIIRKALNSGTIYGATSAGGIVGYSFGSNQLTESVNAGNVTGNSYAGGIVSSGVNTDIFSSLINLAEWVVGQGEVVALVPNTGQLNRLYRWLGLSSSSQNYQSFNGDSTSGTNGAQVNCSNFSEQNWWTNTLEFNAQDWNLDSVGAGYLPMLKNLARLIPNSQLLIPYQCMVTVSTNDIARGSAGPNPGTGITQTTVVNPNTKIYRYPANLNILTFSAQPAQDQGLADWSIAQDLSGVPPKVFSAPPAGLSFTFPDPAKNALIIADQTLAAHFEPLFRVNFNTNGGTYVEAQIIPNGNTATEPLPPSKTDSTFIGWYLDSNFSGSPFDFASTPIVSDIELFARWQWNFDPQSYVNQVELSVSDHDLSLDWKFPEATGFNALYSLANPLQGFIQTGSFGDPQGQLNLGSKFAGTYTIVVEGTITYGQTTTAFSRTTSTVIPLTEQKSPSSVSFPDVNTTAKTVKYDGVKKAVKVPAVNQARLDSIKWLAGYGVTVGSGSSGGKATYRPQDPVNRGAMAQFLQKLAGFSDENIATAFSAKSTKITDISQFKSNNSARYYAILWLADIGITVGCNVDGTKFCPNSPVTRGAMAEFMQKFAGLEPSPANVSDFPDVTTGGISISYDGFKKTEKVPALNANRIGAINWMKTAGITVGSGKSNGKDTYRPQDPVNRGAMAQFMHKLAYAVGSTTIEPV